MKRKISIAIAILIASICAVSAYGKTYDLRCENMTEPLGIDSTIPHFSWKNDMRQESYRIQLAASSADLLSGNLIWDSGTVSSDASVMVPYSGPALSSRQLCWWRVAVNGTWSEPKRFSIGIIGGSWTSGNFGGEQVSPASVPEGMTAAQLDRCGSINAGPSRPFPTFVFAKSHGHGRSADADTL